MVNYLIDVSWMLYRGYYSMSHVYKEYPELHFLCRKIESLLSRKDAFCFLCLDGRTPKGRRILGEQYKAGRHKEDSYNVYSGLASFVKLLNNDRIKVIFNDNYESDELIYTLSRMLDGRKKILSGDKDLLQALTKDVIIDNGSNLVITEESYKFDYADKFFEIDPYRLPIFRAIVGDSSDTLKPPVSRFPKKLAAKIAKDVSYNGSVPTIEQLQNISLLYSDSEKKWVNKLIEAYVPFSINFDIMKLNVITDCITEQYIRQEVSLDDFLTSKILKLNTL
jgi:DNA polymerase-1